MQREAMEHIPMTETFIAARDLLRQRNVPHLQRRMREVNDLLIDTRMSPFERRQRLYKEAATTSDFPLLFSNVLERQMVAAYKAAEPDVFAYIGQGIQNDFRSKDWLSAHGGEGALPKVLEHGEYKGIKISEGKVTSVLEKFGRAYPYSWETLLNDNLGALAPAAKVARAARRTVWREATNLIAETAGPHAGLYGAPVTHPLDGKSITNLGSRALTVDTFGLAVQDMADQVDFDGEPIIIENLHLVVPPAGRTKAFEVLESETIVAAGTAGSVTIRGSRNPAKLFNVKLHVNPYLPIINTTNGVSTWLLFADPGTDGPAAVLNFLRGRVTPEVVFKSSDKVAAGG
ncbi:hypothetical protein LCGC14_3052110, partial [marine sediment metagenome]